MDVSIGIVFIYEDLKDKKDVKKQDQAREKRKEAFNKKFLEGYSMAIQDKSDEPVVIKVLNPTNKFSKEAHESDSDEEDVKTAIDSDDLKGMFIVKNTKIVIHLIKGF